MSTKEWLPCVYCSHITLEDEGDVAALQLSSAILLDKMAVYGFRSQGTAILVLHLTITFRG